MRRSESDVVPLCTLQDVLREDFDVDGYAARLVKSSERAEEHMKTIDQLVEETNQLIKRQVSCLQRAFSTSCSGLGTSHGFS